MHISKEDAKTDGHWATARIDVVWGGNHRPGVLSCLQLRTSARPSAHRPGLCARVYEHVFVSVSLSSGVCVFVGEFMGV